MSEINFQTLKSFDGTVSEGDFNKLVDVVARVVLNNGVGYNVRRSVAGTVITGLGKGGGANLVCPFTVKLATDADDPDSLTLTLTPGTVNNFLPANMFDPFTIAKSDTTYVKATVTTDGQNVTSIELNVDTGEPDQQDATASSLPTSFDIVLALVKDSKAYRTIGCGSIFLLPVQAFVTDKDPPADPGELTYIPYYVWQVTVA